MKGDYSRIPFNERKKMQHYRKVYLQQGKVLLDSDLNENTDLLHYQMKTLAKDGLCGSPNIGFRIGRGVPLLPVDDHRYIGNGKGWSVKPEKPPLTIEYFDKFEGKGSLKINATDYTEVSFIFEKPVDLSQYRYIRLALKTTGANPKLFLECSDGENRTYIPLKQGQSTVQNEFSVVEYTFPDDVVIDNITKICLNNFSKDTTYYIGAVECSPPMFILDPMTHLKEWSFEPPESAGVSIKNLNDEVVMEVSKTKKMYKKHFFTIDFSKFKTIGFAIKSSSTSAIQFYITDAEGNTSYWNISDLTGFLNTKETKNPDGKDSNTYAKLAFIKEYGFRELSENYSYGFGSIHYEMPFENNFVISGADPLSGETGRLYVDGELYEKEEAETYLNQEDCPSAPSMELEYLFNWNQINENNKGRLIEFLAQNYKIEWVKTASIQKIDNDKTIKVAKEEKSLTLTLNDDQTKVNLKIDDATTYEFIAKTEDGMLNIYIYEPANGRKDLVYVDVWQKHVTSADDPELREAAVGVDTCNRMKAVAQVKVLKYKTSLPSELKLTGGGRLSTVVESMEGAKPCEITSGVKYTGAENRLYRVEIHTGGDVGTATYKWSKNNASTVSQIIENVEADAKSVKVKDVNLFKIDDIIEITDDRVELADRYSSEKFNPWGELRKITAIYGDRNELSWAATSAASDDPRNAGLPHDYAAEGLETTHPRVIKWDGAKKTSNEETLEDGIKIRFSGNDMLPGDYWTFTARENTRGVEELDNEPPHGVVHHYYKLAEIEWGANGKIISMEDLRTRFEPLCGLNAADLAFDNANTPIWTDAKNVQQALERITFPKARGIKLENECNFLYGNADNVQDALDNLCNGITVPSLTLKGKDSEQSKWPKLKCSDSGDISFLAGVESLEERMRICADGKVGIGKPNSQFGRLMIEDSAVPLAFRETGVDADKGGLWRMPLDGGILRFDVNTGAPGSEFGSNYRTPLAMTKDGYVGIGTTEPNAYLTVKGQSFCEFDIRQGYGSYSDILFNDSQRSIFSEIKVGDMVTFDGESRTVKSVHEKFLVLNWQPGYYSPDDPAIKHVRFYSTFFRIEDDNGKAILSIKYDGNAYFAGNVGIGKMDPTTPLAIKKADADAPVGITQKQCGDGYSMELTTSDSSRNQATRLILRGSVNDADIEFLKGRRDSEKPTVIIKGETGNVGIGTESPKGRLHISDGTHGLLFYVPSVSTNISHNTYWDMYKDWCNLVGGVGGSRFKMGFEKEAGFSFYVSDAEPEKKDTHLTFNLGLVIRKSGNVGIGTREPKSSLHIKVNPEKSFPPLIIECHTRKELTSEVLNDLFEPLSNNSVILWGPEGGGLLFFWKDTEGKIWYASLSGKLLEQ